MQRSRVSEMPQRPFRQLSIPRRTSSSESDGSHPSVTNRRPIADRNPKLRNRRSPRNPLVERRTSSSESDASLPKLTKYHPSVDWNPKLADRCSPRNPLVEKKLRTRISDLETQLGQVQEELKSFKEQLASAEVDENRDDQKKVEENNKQLLVEYPLHTRNSNKKISTKGQYLQKSPRENAISDDKLETDVFDIPLVAFEAGSHKMDNDVKATQGSSELAGESLVEPLQYPEKMELSNLKFKLAEKDKEIGSVCSENDQLKLRVSEAVAKLSEVRAKEEEAALKLNGMGEELEQTKSHASQVMEELKASVEAKAALETEMKRLWVQTEQWKKAACAAASVLSGEVEVNGQRNSAISLNKQLDGFDSAGFGGFASIDFSEGPESGKNRGTGIRIFGELLKRKGK